MIFNISKTTDRDFSNIEDFKTLEQLIDYIKRIDEEVVIHIFDDGTIDLEIYNGYRE